MCRPFVCYFLVCAQLWTQIVCLYHHQTKYSCSVNRWNAICGSLCTKDIGFKASMLYFNNKSHNAQSHLRVEAPSNVVLILIYRDCTSVLCHKALLHFFLYSFKYIWFTRHCSMDELLVENVFWSKMLKPWSKLVVSTPRCGKHFLIYVEHRIQGSKFRLVWIY